MNDTQFLTIEDAGLVFNRTLDMRSSTIAIVLHHRGGTGDIKSLHYYHLYTNKWAGCGYNFYIRLDGSIWKGRGWEHIGAHAGNTNDYNSKSIGICFEGDFHNVLSEMPGIQFLAGLWLCQAAINLYPTISEIVGHRDVYATACPGYYFPLEKMIKEVWKEEEELRYETFNDVPEWAKPTIENLIAKGVLAGDGSGKIDLSEDMIRLLVINDRMGLYD